MTDYINDTINNFSEPLGTIKTPTEEYLFNVREGIPMFSNKWATEQHNMANKGLFDCKRVRPDIQPRISFLINRVKYTGKDNYPKLIILMQYLLGTQDLRLILRSDHKNIIKWYIYTPHAVYNDTRGHTGVR